MLLTLHRFFLNMIAARKELIVLLIPNDDAFFFTQTFLSSIVKYCSILLKLLVSVMCWKSMTTLSDNSITKCHDPFQFQLDNKDILESISLYIPYLFLPHVAPALLFT